MQWSPKVDDSLDSCGHDLYGSVVVGTRTYGILDGNCSNSSGAYLMAITEKVVKFSTVTYQAVKHRVLG